MANRIARHQAGWQRFLRTGIGGITCLLASATAGVPDSATLAPENARRELLAARTIVYREAPRLWPGFATTPFRVDLIGPDREWLFCRPEPATGFGAIIRDPVTGCDVQSRPRQLADDLEAAFPIAGIGPAIAIHLPDAAPAGAATAWRLTILHESFHLYQYALPGYLDATQQARRALDAQSDNWPIDYAFPYKDWKVAVAFARMSDAARQFLNARAATASLAALCVYVAARHQAALASGERNWRYYEFQVGQEGVARWTEIRLGEMSGDPALAALADERRFGLATSLNAIDTQGLGTWKRSAFYVFGAIEAEMLERWQPGWRDMYRRAPFRLGAQLNAAARRCR